MLVVRGSCLAAALLPLVLVSCVSRVAHDSAVNRAEHSERALAEMKEFCLALQEENDRLRGRARELETRVVDADWVRGEKERLRRLLGELGAADDTLTIPGVRLFTSPEGVGFEIQGEVLFASGRAEITPQGKETLKRVAPALRAGSQTIRIDGHTDADPIRFSPWGTNLRLSAERSLAVAHFLLEEGGVPEERLTVAGFGPNKPRSPGESPEAKRENRRVEVLLLREE